MYENSTELLEYKARVIDPLFSKIKIYPQHVFRYENHKMEIAQIISMLNTKMNQQGIISIK